MAKRAPSRIERIPTHEMIAMRAYERWIGRGGGHGRDVEDWLAAEAELREELARQAAGSEAEPV